LLASGFVATSGTQKRRAQHAAPLRTGQRLDDSTDLLYYGARYYDPALRRWVQADTIVPNPQNPQALNRYSYVLNNPLRYTDPTGHWTFETEPDEDPLFVPPYQGRPGQRRQYPTHQPTTAEVIAVATSPFWGGAVTLGGVALAEAAGPIVLTKGFLARGTVGGGAGIAGDVWSYWLTHGTLEGYDWERALGVFVPNFLGGGALGEMYPYLANPYQRVLAASATNTTVASAQRMLVGDPLSAGKLAFDAAIGTVSGLGGEVFSNVLNKRTKWSGTLVESLSAFVTHSNIFSSLVQGIGHLTSSLSFP